MSTFLNAFQAESTVGFTENGAMTYTSTLDHNLDFFALASAKRSTPGEAVSLFNEAYNENAALSILNLFYLRDVRGGHGERSIFRFCLEQLESKYLVNENFLRLIPEYGRWDDLLILISSHFWSRHHPLGALVCLLWTSINFHHLNRKTGNLFVQKQN